MSDNTAAPTRLDLRSLFVLDTRELGRRPGSLRAVRREVIAPAGFRLELIGVPEGAPLELDLRLESVSEGVLVSGTVTASTVGECARCLDPVDGEVVVDLQELFAYRDSVTDGSSDDDEVRRLQGDHLDLEPAIRDAVVLALPSSPLCEDDCAGLCVGCGRRWDDLPLDHAHDEADPRWAALRKLSSDRTTESQE